MALSILYCGECDKILAASPELGLVAECLAHSIGEIVHRGYRALRLAAVEITATDLVDLEILAQKFVKRDYADQLEPLVGSCP
jgi:hypothetical protein